MRELVIQIQKILILLTIISDTENKRKMENNSIYRYDQLGHISANLNIQVILNYYLRIYLNYKLNLIISI